MPTWTDSQIDRWQKDAEEDIISRVYTRWTSFSLEITSGTGTYTFNERIYRPTAVLWKGKHIYPYIGNEIHAQVPKFRTEQGDPTN
jgi:hypothetical protein